MSLPLVHLAFALPTAACAAVALYTGHPPMATLPMCLLTLATSYSIRVPRRPSPRRVRVWGELRDAAALRLLRDVGCALLLPQESRIAPVVAAVAVALRGPMWFWAVDAVAYLLFFSEPSARLLVTAAVPAVVGMRKSLQRAAVAYTTTAT